MRRGAQSTLAVARGTQEVALAACRRRCCWASVLASSRLGSGGASSAPHVALRGKWMVETCSPRKIGPRNKPLGSGMSKRRLGKRRVTFLRPMTRLGVPWILDHKSGTGGVGGGAPDEHITVIPYLNSGQKTTPTRFLLQLAQLGLLGGL